MSELGVDLIWIVGIVGSLLLTLVILKLVFLVHRVLQHIVDLAEVILTASRGIGANVRSLRDDPGQAWHA